MKVAILSYERNIGIEDKEVEIQYFDWKTENLIQKVKDFAPDLLIEREFNDGKARYENLYKELPRVIKAYWCIDAHITLAEHINYAKQFDFVFLAQSWFKPLFENQVRGECFYLPLCFPQPRSWFDQERVVPERSIPLSFVGWIRTGLHDDRKHFVEHLLKYLGDRFFPTREMDYEKMTEIVRSSKAIFNCSLNNDLNFRVWEAIGNGCLPITDLVTDVDSVAGLSSKLFLYEKLISDWDFEGRIDLAMTISTMDEKIFNPKANVEWIKKYHTLTNRYQEMILMMSKGEQYAY